MDNERILIVGGTGSLGKTLIKRYVDSNLVCVFSRDESKHWTIKNQIKSKNLKFIIGDIRDKNTLFKSSFDVDYIFHAAALKQVPSCEFYPIEAVKTNILGTENVLNSAIENNVQKVICLSTDKAVYPINAMGVSKAMMERVMISKARMRASGASEAPISTSVLRAPKG